MIIRHPATDPGDWPLRTGRHSFCPRCGSPDVRLRTALSARLASLAGMQLKFAAAAGWAYRCFECGDTGPCEIRESMTARLARDHAGG